MAHQHGSLRSKFIANFLLIGVLPLLLMGVLSVYLVNLSHRQDINALEDQLISQKVEEINRFINETSGLLQIQVGYEQKTEPESDQQKFLLESLLFTNKNFIEASLIYAIEAQGINPPPVLNCRGENIDQMQAFGHEICRFSQIQSEESLELTNQSKLDKFIVPLSGRDYFGSVYYTLNGPAMTLASPVKNKNGEIIAVLSAELSLAPIQKILSRSQLGEKGYVFLLDNNANLLAHSLPDFLQRKEFSNLKFFKNIPEGDSYLSVFGENVFGFTKLIPKSGWKIFVEWPVNDAQSIVYDLSGQALRFSLVVLILVILFSIWISYQIIKPIQELRLGAQIIGGGKFDQPIQIKTNDEIEDLGESLNLMAQDLKKVEELRELKIKAEALAESLRKEKELSQIKDSFITNASHQFRTPISVIRWLIELLGSEKSNKPLAEVKSTITEIYDNTKKLSQIVGDLLLISELGIGYKKKNEKKIDFIILLNEIIDEYKNEIENKKVKIQFLKPEKLEILAQRQPLKQAFGNLIINAITYSREGGDIKIELKKQDNEMLFSIQDSGIGIPEQDKSLIFSQFFRGKNSIEMKNVGTGLGLFIVKTVIDGHDGKIWFESEQNKGTTFYINLPLE